MGLRMLGRGRRVSGLMVLGNKEMSTKRAKTRHNK